MNTIRVPNHIFRQMLGNILIVFVILTLVFPTTGSALAQDELPPEPFLVAAITEHWMWAYNFHPDSLVTITVYETRDSVTPVLELSRQADAMGNVEIQGWEHDWDLEPGNYMVATDGVITDDLFVDYITLDVFDPDSDIISGKTSPGREVAIGVGGQSGEYWMNVFADPDTGVWEGNFAAIGFNITGDMWASGNVYDEDGDITAVHNSGPALPPIPFIWADPICNCVNGWDWPDGSAITIEVFDHDSNPFPIQTATQTYSADAGVFFDLGAEGIDLQPGHRVTMSDGSVTKELIVVPLTVKEMNPVANTISGIFDPNLPLVIYTGGQDPLSLDFNDDRWIATFGSLPLDGFGEVYQPDDDGDKTGMGWDGVPAFMRYDIYSLDVESMNVQRITMLNGTGEYNPSWSPNGKKIAHDVAYWDGSHGIFVTDVDTGVTSPLLGADGGNDAVWSPNGKWIAFDRRWVGDPSVYIVPAAGGDAMLVRENAYAADWAPNGKRIVFQDLDGSLRTVAVGEGKGTETIIADYGSNPSWSPDGNWIAYESGGDIWKVAVNVQGTKLGDPIQITSGPYSEDQPTWSADSLRIIFHSNLNGDFDLWEVAATGGNPTWTTGVPGADDYDPAYARNQNLVAYESLLLDE